MDVPGEVAKHRVAGAFGDDLVAYGLRRRSRFGSRFGPLREGFGQSYEGRGIGFFVGFPGFSGDLVEYIDVLNEIVAVRSQRADPFFGFTMVTPRHVENVFEDGEDTLKAEDAMPADVKVRDVFAGFIVFKPIPMVASDWSVFHARALLCGSFGKGREKLQIWTIFIHGHLGCKADPRVVEVANRLFGMRFRVPRRKMMPVPNTKDVMTAVGADRKARTSVESVPVLVASNRLRPWAQR